MSDMACGTCGGAGTVDRDGKTYECECSLWKRIASSMPSYVLTAKFLPQHLESPLLKSVGRSCFITAAWIDMRAIVKAVMMKHYGKYVRITSDRQLRDVFVGSKSRANLEEDAKVVYNSVEDLMGGGDPKGRGPGGPDLVVLRLNELGYKNKAASGILEEALVCRLDYGRPTWVVSDLDKPFGTGSHAYSETVWDLLTTSFTQVRIPRISPRNEPPPPPQNSLLGSAWSGDDAPEPQRAPREAREARESAPASTESRRPPETRPAPPEAGERPRRGIQPVPDDDAPSGLGMYGMGLGRKGKLGSSKKPFGKGD